MLIDQLKNAHPELSDLRVREVLIDKQNKKISCVLSYPEYDKLLEFVRQSIITAVKNSIPQDFSCTVRFENDYFSAESFLKFVFQLIKNHFVVLSVIPKKNFEVAKIDTRQFNLRITVSSYQCRLLEECKFQVEFQKLLSQYSCATAKIEIFEDDSQSAVDLEFEGEKQLFHLLKLETFRPKRQKIVTKKSKYIGKLIFEEPVYISDIREDRNNVTVFGTIKNKSTSTAKNNPNLKICKFLLKDESGEMPVIFFIRLKIDDAKILETVKNSAEKAQKTATRNASYNRRLEDLLATLFDGAQVVVRGKAALNSYSNKFEIQGFDLNKCCIEDRVAQKVEKIPEPSEYNKIFPVVTSTSRQISLIDAEQSNDLVLISVNTTGFNHARDRILAVSMTKIRENTIVSTLRTFLNPELKVPQKAVVGCGADVDEFKNYPTLIEVLPDLYKFSFGRSLVGDDISLLVEFLNYYGAPQGICFDNPKEELSHLMETLSSHAEIGKRINFFDLSEVAKKLNVSFDEKKMSQCMEHNSVAAKCLEKLFIQAGKR